MDAPRPESFPIIARKGEHTIFLALANFSNISNALRGRFLEALQSNYRVVVLTEFIDEASARRDGYLVGERIRYVKLPLTYRRAWDWMDLELRHAFIRAYDELLVTQRWVYDLVRSPRSQLLASFGRFLPKGFPTTGTFTAIERLAVRPTKVFRELVQVEKPVLFITATPGYKYARFESEMLIFAKNCGIATMAIDIGIDNPTSQAKFLRKTDAIAVWSTRMAGDVEKYHRYNPEDIFVTGTLKFDHYFEAIQKKILPSREEFLISKKLDPRKKLLVYATPTPVSYPPRAELMAALMRLRETGQFSGDPNVLIRLHPHDVWEPYRAYTEIPGVHVERAGHQRLGDSETKGQKVEMDESDLKNLAATLMHADVIINFASTLILEASIFKTPTVSIGFPEEQRPLVNFEGTIEFMEVSREPVARSPEELAMLTNRYLTEPLKDRARYDAVVEQFIQFTDGQSYRRIIEAIAEVIRRKHR